MAKRNAQIESEIDNAYARVFRTRVHSPANDLFGKFDYTITETIVPKRGGLEISVHSLGVSEGERVDQRLRKFWPNSSMDRAASYRLQNGYVEITKP